MGEESESLMGGASTGVTQNILFNYFVLSCTFSATNGSYTVLFAYISAVFSIKIASYGSALSYLSYMICSLTISAIVVDKYGARKMMLFCLICFSSFSFCGVIALYWPNIYVQWVLMMTGSILKGIGSPIGWVAQGVYFATYAEYYAKDNDLEVDTINKQFATYFGIARIGFQGFFYLLSSVLLEFTDMDPEDLFLLYFGVSMISLIVTWMYLDELIIKDDKKNDESIMTRLFEVMKITTTDPVAICISPMTISFGFVSIFVFVYLNDNIGADYFGTYAIGYLNVLASAAAVLSSIIVSYFFVHSYSIGLGSLCYMLLSLAFMVFSNEQMGKWKYVWMLYCLYGIGRITWESTTKAIYADLYPHKRSIAFANLTFLTGLSSTVFSFLSSDISELALAICMFIPASLMVPGYLYALKIREDKPIKESQLEIS